MFLLLVSVALAADPAAGTPEFSAEQLKFFETEVRPLLVEHCHDCHGPKTQWANLRLDSREAILAGGDSGPALVPGKPAESLMIRAVRHEEGAPEMPEGDKLTDKQIATLVRWVEMGAPYPGGVKAADARDPNHWSFQPPVDPPVPTVQNRAWVRSPIDRFILARLEDEGFTPAPQADKVTLIRRVTYDLTGLPPTPEEIAQFVADDRPDAFARLVDRLLESPAYGERWGRHWLDVVRYADSNGLDENIAQGNAWRYRDYVVDSFNKDKPFNQFVIEQVAGDLLPYENDAQRREQLIATGFLSIGPKVLAEPDPKKMEMDIIDEQLDTFGRAFMGMTFGCARCHDHKFDPIQTADYYGLAGIFKSSKTMEHYRIVARWHENILPSPETEAMKAEYEAKLAAKRQAIDEFIAKTNEELCNSLGPGGKLPEKPEEHYPEEAKKALKKLRDELTELEKKPPEYPSAMGVTEGEVADIPIHIRGSHLKLGDVVPRHTPPVMRGPQPPNFTSSQSGRLELAQWLTDPNHPLTARVFVNRVWRWHFGQGLVRTPDNFGLLGEKPTHPELLDWLAHRFIDSGWSIKALHRMILNSATYQQSSLTRPEFIERDPENKLYGRANVRRIEAEAVRDAMLVIAGRLDTSMGGTLLHVKNRGYLFNHTSQDATQYDSTRRSLYLPVIRNNVYDVFQLLDFPDPAISTGNRVTTAVAPQALMMLNSDFVMDCASHFASRLLAEEGSDEQRMDRMYRLAYGRGITGDETRSQLDFLAKVEKALADSEADPAARRQEAWSVLCHTVLASNEFVYVK